MNRIISAVKNPDYIFTSAEGTPSYVTQVLEQFPVHSIQVSPEKINQHINRYDLIGLRTGTSLVYLPNWYIRLLFGQTNQP